MTYLAKFIYSLSASAPLMLVAAALIWSQDRTQAYLLGATAVVLAASCGAFLLEAKKQVEVEFKSAKVTRCLDIEALGFLVVGILLVAASFSYNTVMVLVLAGVWFLVCAALFHFRRDLAYLNPLVTLLGFHTYLATCEDGQIVLVLSRKKFWETRILSQKKFLTGGPLKVSVLTAYLWLQVGDD